MSDLSELSGQNARAWDEIAQVRALRFPPADFFAGGGSTLVDRDLEAVGPVGGASLLHLQCATGEDTLSWAVHGARAVGVDTGWGHFDAGGLGTEPKFEFVFPLGDVITALVRAGLRVVRLEEFPGGESYRFGGELEQVSRLPGSYVLVAVRGE